MFEGTRLKQQRMALCLSQDFLASELNVHINTIRRWEQGKQSPDAQKLIHLAEALNTTVAYLSGETNNPIREIKENNENGNEESSSQNYTASGTIMGNSHVLFYEGNGERFTMPATKENQAWFRDFVSKKLSHD